MFISTNEINFVILEKELKLNNLLIISCAIIKTIGVIIGVVFIIACIAWLAVNISFPPIITFWLWTLIIIISMAFVVGDLFMKMYRSCKASNQKKP